MLRRVRIKSMPKARTGYQVNGGLANDVPSFGGADYNAYIGEQPSEVKRTLSAVPRKEANLEAEGGETVIGNIDGSMMPSFFTITGPRHSSGGVPLNLPDDSFIFSDTKSMKISDPTILKMFNANPKKGGYTPADLSKKYDLNRYRKILQDPDSDKMDRKTAEMMIKNYTMKLGALALAQESKKGFPQGIPELSKPYMESNGITEEDLLPQKPQPQQQMPPQEMMEAPEMEGMEEMPMEMPNGEQIAQPQSMEQDMAAQEMMQQQAPMAYGGQPMAMYGMSMGGYEFPYESNEMAYGGLTKAQTGVITPYEEARTKQGNVTPTGTSNKFSSRKQSLNDYLKQWEDSIPGIGKMTEGQAQKAIYEWTLKNNPESIKNMWTTHGLTAKGMKNAKLKALSKDGSGKFTEEQLKDPKLLEQLQDAYVDNYFGVRQLDPVKAEEVKDGPVSTECPCLDDKGVAIAGKFAQKNEKDECMPETCTPKESCECDRADGTVYDPGMNTDGSCKECEEIITEEGDVVKPPAEKREPEWWLQDTVNTMGAFGDMMSAKKYMPWEARVDLEEPRPTFLDPTRELAAQSEQANIAAQAAASFAGPQALNARLSQTQGQGARAAADTLGRINNQNVNIANQFEANQVGVRNQENQMNQQIANRVYDKNVIANQQFDNAKRQGAANMRQAYNTAVTNRMKTDALNQMYPNYQTRPGVGGRVEYTPTDKTVDPGAKQATMGEELKELMSQGFSKESAEKYLLNKYKKKGGSTTGYVYTDWPIFL
jgi:hypothetical protein